MDKDTCGTFVAFDLFVFVEKEKRVKSGSAGEASSSSYSERSNSSGSLKGAGKKVIFISFIYFHLTVDEQVYY